jgi:hypothetical protein
VPPVTPVAKEPTQKSRTGALASRAGDVSPTAAKVQLRCDWAAPLLPSARCRGFNPVESANEETPVPQQFFVWSGSLQSFLDTFDKVALIEWLV